MQVEGRELQSALQYQVLSTGLQHGHLVMVGGVQSQQSILPQKQVSVTYLHMRYYVARWLHNENWVNSTGQISTSWTMSLSDNLDVLTYVILSGVQSVKSIDTVTQAGDFKQLELTTEGDIVIG